MNTTITTYYDNDLVDLTITSDIIWIENTWIAYAKDTDGNIYRLEWIPSTDVCGVDYNTEINLDDPSDIWMQ